MFYLQLSTLIAKSFRASQASKLLPFNIRGLSFISEMILLTTSVGNAKCLANSSIEIISLT